MMADPRLDKLQDALNAVLLACVKGEATLPPALLQKLKLLGAAGIGRVPALATTPLKKKPPGTRGPESARSTATSVRTPRRSSSNRSNPNTPRRIEDLYEAGRLRTEERRRDEVRLQREEEEFSKFCTFSPSLSAKTHRIDKGREARPYWERMGGSAASEQMQSRQSKYEAKSKELSLKGCTYHPVISKRERRDASLDRSAAGDNVFERLYSHVEPAQANAAATKIQAVARGKITRTRLHNAIERLYNDAAARSEKRRHRFEELYDFPFQPDLKAPAEKDELRSNASHRPRSVSPSNSHRSATTSVRSAARSPSNPRTPRRPASTTPRRHSTTPAAAAAATPRSSGQEQKVAAGKPASALKKPKAAAKLATPDAKKVVKPRVAHADPAVKRKLFPARETVNPEVEAAIAEAREAEIRRQEEATQRERETQPQPPPPQPQQNGAGGERPATEPEADAAAPAPAASVAVPDPPPQAAAAGGGAGAVVVAVAAEVAPQVDEPQPVIRVSPASTTNASPVASPVHDAAAGAAAPADEKEDASFAPSLSVTTLNASSSTTSDIASSDSDSQDHTVARMDVPPAAATNGAPDSDDEPPPDTARRSTSNPAAEAAPQSADDQQNAQRQAEEAEAQENSGNAAAAEEQTRASAARKREEEEKEEAAAKLEAERQRTARENAEKTRKEEEEREATRKREEEEEEAEKEERRKDHEEAEKKRREQEEEEAERQEAEKKRKEEEETEEEAERERARKKVEEELAERRRAEEAAAREEEERLAADRKRKDEERRARLAEEERKLREQRGLGRKRDDGEAPPLSPRRDAPPPSPRPEPPAGDSDDEVLNLMRAGMQEASEDNDTAAALTRLADEETAARRKISDEQSKSKRVMKAAEMSKKQQAVRAGADRGRREQATPPAATVIPPLPVSSLPVSAAGMHQHVAAHNGGGPVTQDQILGHCNQHASHYRKVAFRREAQWRTFVGLWSEGERPVAEDEMEKIWEAAMNIPETDGESSAPTPDTTPREGKTQRALRFLGFGSRSGDSEVALTATNSAASLSSVGSARSSPSVEPKSSPRRFGEQRKRPILQKSVGAAAADAPTTPRAPPPAPVATDESGQSPGALHLSPSGRRRRSRCGSPSAQLPKETILERVRHIYIEKEGKSARNVELIMKEYEDNVHDLYDMLCRRHELSFDD